MPGTEQNTIEGTKARLEEIERELAELNEERNKLKSQWELEKELISSIRSMKSEVEQLRNEAADYERKGDVALPTKA